MSPLPFFGRRKPPIPEADVLRDTAPAERRRYRDLDLANIISRIDRFSTGAVESGWKTYQEQRKRHPDLPLEHPVLRQPLEHSLLALVNFIRNQLYDPELRRERLLAALDLQQAAWEAIAEKADAASKPAVDTALALVAARRADPAI